MAANGRRILSGGVTALLLVCLGVTGGCEAIVTDQLPSSYSCSGDGNGGCPGSLVCFQGQCVQPNNIDCTTQGCPSGTHCDTSQHVCIQNATDGGGNDAPVSTDAAESSTDSPPPDTSTGCRSLGCPCSGPSDCDSGICGDALTLTANVINQTPRRGNVCTAPCCISDDCPTGSVCYPAATGGNYCVVPSWLGRATPKTNPSSAGGSCTTGSDCRSGVCAGGTTCADSCCALTACPGSLACKFGQFGGTAGIDNHFTWSCSASTGGAAPQSTCIASTDCASNLCANFGAGAECIEPCRNSPACPTGYVCGAFTTTTSGNDVLIGCVPDTAAGAGLVATTCSANGTCRSDLCDTSHSLCTDQCFGDSDCGTLACLTLLVSVQGGGSAEALSCEPK